MTFLVVRARRGLMRRPQWRVVLVHDNGNTLLTSETYNNREDAERMIATVRLGALKATVEVEA